MALAGTLFAIMLLVCCLHRLQKKAHSQVLQSKRELKRIYLLKQAEDLRDTLESMSSISLASSSPNVIAGIDDE